MARICWQQALHMGNDKQQEAKAEICPSKVGAKSLEDFERVKVKLEINICKQINFFGKKAK